ncbi:MAG TPA: YIP1 family protein [Steroidobacteraceae bacterium]|nr:YIP1 family protein [Steroidobacteraceae bacterium]
MNTCPKCNKPVAPNARFCGSCGQQIEAAAPAPAPQSSAGAAPGSPAAALAGSAAAATSKAWAAATASAPGLLERIKNIVLTPKSEWLVIAPEPTTVSQLFPGYVVPLAALAACLGFVRMSVLGVSTAFGGGFRMPISSGLVYTLIMFLSALFGVFVVGLIINALAPTFAGQRDQRQAVKVAAYSLTPALLSSVLALSPILATLLQLLAGLYGIYVLYLGLPVLMQSPKEKAFGYTATVVICTFLIGVVLMALTTFAHIGGAHLGSSGAAPAQDQGAATVADAIGNALGTDAKGKADLGAALSNLAKSGESHAAASSAGGAAQPGTNAASADGAQNAQTPLSAAGGLMTALGGAMGGSQRVATVDYKDLTAMLPASLPGMKRTSAQGENQGAVGVKTSSAKADYAGNDGSGVHIEIADISAVSGLMDLAGGLIQTTTSQSDSGFEKDVSIGGRTVHEKYDARNKQGDLSVILAKRFSVDVSGRGVDMGTLEQSLGQIDLARLESMKNAGA